MIQATLRVLSVGASVPAETISTSIALIWPDWITIHSGAFQPDHFTTTLGFWHNMKTYKDLLKEYENSDLSELGVKLPRQNTQKGQVLLYLYQQLGRVVTKAQAEKVVCERLNIQSKDLQSLRHLGKQDGFNILQAGSASGGGYKLKRGEYMLMDLKTVNPYFDISRRDESNLDFQELKKRYRYTCATCGTVEGKKHRYSDEVAMLEKGHKDPARTMENFNIIPQCQLCNKVAKDNWVFDDYGRVTRITPQGLLVRHSKIQKIEFLEVLLADLT